MPVGLRAAIRVYLACPTTGDPSESYYSDFCAQGCIEQVGYCGSDGFCHCGYIP